MIYIRLHLMLLLSEGQAGEDWEPSNKAMILFFGNRGKLDRKVLKFSEGYTAILLDYGRSPHAYVNQGLQIQLELLMMSGMPLETCLAFNERWIYKFDYKVASCWLFLLSKQTLRLKTLITRSL